MEIRTGCRTHRIAAERLLTGDPAIDGEPARLLADAAGPVAGRTPSGEDDAVAVFRAAVTVPADAAAMP